MIALAAFVVTYILGSLVTAEYMDVLDEIEVGLEPLPRSLHYLFIALWPLVALYSYTMGRLGGK